ncbi:FG-GAP and VCBS repeat-containing protein [Actinomadura alba]|uniref:FG-GAP repeat protein n=1 Tax=Actinomadura alba TaxID=406431 RepID=A0ABR7LVH9_9ACTN|nr:FG-GAP and VCBS repeat-containing protein [Actinomadura alba]MBC6468460.1 FG-GAP repeat protein [Actinomadura alba]
MKSRLFVRTAAIAAVTALGGLGLAGLAPSASAAAPAKAYDFNGDGYQDLAIGSPYGKVGTYASAGFVSVVYGTANGPTGRKQVISQNSAGVPGTAETSDHFGYSLASADFDSDGYADLVVGTPDEDTTAGANGGLITIFWGTPDGLVTDVVQNIDDEMPAANNRWGENLTTGMIEPGAPVKLFLTIPGQSTFTWFYFIPAEGARAAGKPAPKRGESVVVPRKKGMSTRSVEDVTSSWLATGDVTGDGIGDVAYAWYDADWPEPSERRGFSVYPGTADGGFDGTAGTGDLTEVNSIAIGDFEKDGFGDVVVGQPSDAVKGGQVTAYKGSASGVSPDAKTSIHRDTPGVPGTAAAGDAFGASIAAGDVNNDGKSDLAVGIANDEVGTVVDGGRAYVLFGGPTGLGTAGAEDVSQNSEGVPGDAETGDHFGYQVTVLDNNQDGYGDVSAGAPNEDSNAGVVIWLKGGTQGVRPPTGPITGSVMLTAATFGVTGRNAELGRRLGK